MEGFDIFSRGVGFFETLCPDLFGSNTLQKFFCFFRFLPKSDKEINQLNYAIRKTLQEEGEFYMVQTVVKGRAFLRITIINQHTTEVHLDRLLEAVERVVLVLD